jgi:hypothetical protein
MTRAMTMAIQKTTVDLALINPAKAGAASSCLPKVAPHPSPSPSPTPRVNLEGVQKLLKDTNKVLKEVIPKPTTKPKSTPSPKNTDGLLDNLLKPKS